MSECLRNYLDPCFHSLFSMFAFVCVCVCVGVCLCVYGYECVRLLLSRNQLT